MLVAAAIILLTVGVNSYAEAANLTNVKDTLTDSNPGSVSNHEIEFVVPTNDGDGLAEGETFTITFPAGFNMGSVGEADIDLAIDGVDATTGATASGATWGVAVSSQDITFTSDTETIAEGATVTVEVGTNADGGTNQVTNPGSEASYEFFIDFAPEGSNDTGRTRVAIVDNVLVTATVDTVFDFTVSGFNSAGVSINGTSTTGSTTATEIPFGTLSPGQIKTLGQRLNVDTNARNGFVVTVQTSDFFESSTGAIIDNFVDGGDASTPSAWATPSRDISDETTWGHWGVTSADDTANAGSPFGANNFIAASTSARTVFTHDGPADSTIADVGSTTVAYQVEITALQEAGDDYNTTLTYIATPTF